MTIPVLETRTRELGVMSYQFSPPSLLSYKVSMRSNHTVDVSRVASYFGGGGHKKAAGCTITGSVYDVINNLSQQIVLQLPLESGS